MQTFLAQGVATFYVDGYSDVPAACRVSEGNGSGDTAVALGL